MLPEMLDYFAHQQSAVHRLGPRLKVAVAAGLIGAVALAPLALWPVHAAVGAVLSAALVVARVPVRYWIRRLLLFWPMVLLLAVGIPLSHGFDQGWDRMSVILVKATLAFLTLLVLMATTPFERVLWGLRALGVPVLLVAVIGLMVRYLAVLTDELLRMQRARASRTFHRPRPADWLELPKLIGRLFIRSLERGERIHQAMLARGWTGEIHLL